MNKKIRWKIILVIAVIALAVFLAYPPGEKINLGLDLRGGMHLVLEVVTDDAVVTETDQEIARFKEELNENDISFEIISKTSGQIAQFYIEGFPPDKQGEVRQLVEEKFQQWDIRPSSERITLTIKSGVESYLREQSVRQSLQTIGNRVDELGLTEPTIQRQGLTGSRIIVELPGVEDPERVKEILKTTAKLEFRLVLSGPAPDRETLLAQHGQ